MASISTALAALPADRAPSPEAACAASTTTCLHCGLDLAPHDVDGFCCAGCRAVYRLIQSEGLSRYYRIRSGAGRPLVDAVRDAPDRKWLEPIEERLACAADATAVSLDVQGIHCSACVWLIQEMFRREPHGLQAMVNPALGRVDLTVEPGFALRGWITAIERFGYRFGPPLKDTRSTADALLVRAGVCVALAANAMIFGFAMHLGLTEGPVHTMLAGANAVIATLSLALGGTIFIRSAWRSLAAGVLHLDTPIAFGIVLAYAGSMASYLWAGDTANYLDTVAVFIALMVLGRWLQERVLERNRRELLADDGVDGLLTRRVRDGRVELVECRAVQRDDELWVAPGDLVPLDAVVLGAPATLTLDWINGESEPRVFAAGSQAPAGSFNAGGSAVSMRALTSFADSPIVRLLATPRERLADAARSTPWWQRVASSWVIGVLIAAVAGLAGWWLLTGDALRAFEVTTAVLVVTCPCAFGIASPLAYELVQAGLRRAGLFVRAAGFLDRVVSVKRVVFDKTGTLTTGHLGVANPDAIDALEDAERQLLFDLVAQSSHPKSAAVRRHLEARGVVLARRLAVIEKPGSGLEAEVDGHDARFGAPRWAASDAPADADVVFAIDGRTRAALRTAEELRRDARAEIEWFQSAGLETWILSGDSDDRVAVLARELGVAPEHAIGDASPDGKAEWLSRHDHDDTLMVGDGINDSLVVANAWCSGTPAVDRPFMAARSDFYFTTAGLAPLRRALLAARRLRAVLERNLAWAVAYNALAVTLALAGLMKPWLAAVLMPLSSIAIVAATATSLGPRSNTWRS
ncbi:MAG: heavy metal translocating P-type ATPase metal-binding domain-containing protein [bacterium]